MGVYMGRIVPFNAFRYKADTRLLRQKKHDIYANIFWYNIHP